MTGCPPTGILLAACPSNEPMSLWMPLWNVIWRLCPGVLPPAHLPLVPQSRRGRGEGKACQPRRSGLNYAPTPVMAEDSACRMSQRESIRSRGFRAAKLPLPRSTLRGTQASRQNSSPGRENAPPFSLDWLMFVEEAVPFFGRITELDAIRAFLDDAAPFSWWCMVGPGGTGKSRLALQAGTDVARGLDRWVPAERQHI